VFINTYLLTYTLTYSITRRVHYRGICNSGNVHITSAGQFSLLASATLSLMRVVSKSISVAAAQTSFIASTLSHV